MSPPDPHQEYKPRTITERKLRIATKALWKILAYADCLPTDAALEVKQAIAQIEERKIDLNSPLPVCGSAQISASFVPVKIG